MCQNMASPFSMLYLLVHLLIVIVHFVCEGFIIMIGVAL